MQKVVRMHPRCVTLLTTQYRMNEDIMAFSSRWFYHGRLQAAPEVAHRLVSPLDTPLTWLDTSEHSDYSENSEYSEKKTKTGSLTNASEARLVIHALRDYVEMISPQKIESERIDFGIITPYRGQARLIRRLLKMQHYFRKLKRHITVGTVDGFQGQERDVIVISLVRDNADGQIGFLRDLRRMNVAITRARMKLIVVGNAETLSRHRFYRELAEHFRAHGDFIQLPVE
jgi:superfamily I DNA and/or RNA helicase